MSSVRRFGPVLLVGSFYASGFGVTLMLGSSWTQANLFKRIRISGNRQLGFHNHAISGDSEAFRSSNYFGQGRISDVGQLTVTGNKVLNVFNFNFQVQNNRFGSPLGQRFSTTYENRGWLASAGDIQASLGSSNTFVSYGRSLNGLQFGYSGSAGDFRILQTQSRGTAQTISLNGNGSVGPYYLNSNQLIQDSDRILLDNQPLVRGTDYTLNYESGVLTFTRAVPQTSSIVVTFEAFGQNSAAMRGFNGGLNLGRGSKVGRLGFTALQQTQRGQRGLGQRTDLFQGYGDPATPYTLTLVPINVGSVRITVDGIPQGLGGDYRFDAVNPLVFYFNRFISPNSTVSVVYTPKPSQVVDGDRQVVGMDYSINLGPKETESSFNISLAKGSLSNTPTPQSGYAKGMGFKSRLGRYGFNANYTDIDPEFVSVESLGFNRNQRALNFGVSGYEKGIKFSLNNTNSAISLRSTDANGKVTFNPARTVTTELNTSFLRENRAPIGLNFTRQNSNQTNLSTQLDTTRLSTSQALGRWTGRMELENIGGMRHDAQGDQTLALQSLKLSADSPVSPTLKIGTKVGLSRQNSSGQSAQGRDVSVAATFTPNSRFSSSLNYTQSKAGALAALSNFQGGAGLGYDGNGFSGATLGTNFSSAPTNLNSLSFNANYRATDKISFGGRLSATESSGGSSSNTRNLNIGGDMNWEPNSKTRIYGSLDFSRSKFLAVGSTSSNTAITGDISGDLSRGFSYSVRGLAFFSSGSSYSQNSLSLDSLLRKRLSQNEFLAFQIRQAIVSGYQGQNEKSLGLSYERRLWNMLSLTASYRLRDVSNTALASGGLGAYRSNGLDIDINFNFGQ